MTINERGNRSIPTDDSSDTRALIVFMLHELVGVRTNIANIRRLTNYTYMHSGMDAGNYDAPVNLDVAARAIDNVIASVTEYLKAQVIGLYDSNATAARLVEDRMRLAEREREREMSSAEGDCDCQ